MVLMLDTPALAQLLQQVGIETFIKELADRIEADFIDWPRFDKSARFAAHSPLGVLELMPAADAEWFSFKLVNGPFHIGGMFPGNEMIHARKDYLGKPDRLAQSGELLFQPRKETTTRRLQLREITVALAKLLEAVWNVGRLDTREFEATEKILE